MKTSILLFVIAIIVCSSFTHKTEIQDEVSIYYLIRHAEKDRSDTSNKNADLNAVGLLRAENWAKYFKSVKFDMIYSTDYNRTNQTAMPTAKANNVELHFYNPTNVQIEDFLQKTKGKTVLIVGHSNTIPKFANQLLDEDVYEEIDDNNNANLYIVTITKDTKTSRLLVVN